MRPSTRSLTGKLEKRYIALASVVALLLLIPFQTHAAIIFSDHHSLMQTDHPLQSRAIELAIEKQAMTIDPAQWNEFKPAENDQCKQLVSVLDQFLLCFETSLYADEALDS